MASSAPPDPLLQWLHGYFGVIDWFIGCNVTDVMCEVKVEYSVTSKETKKLSEFHQISKLWDFRPLAVTLHQRLT